VKPYQMMLQSLARTIVKWCSSLTPILHSINISNLHQ